MLRLIGRKPDTNPDFAWFHFESEKNSINGLREALKAYGNPRSTIIGKLRRLVSADIALYRD